MVVAYVSDPTRRSRFADQLEEEVMQHGAILQRCNVANANLVNAFGASASPPAMPSVPSIITGYLRTALVTDASSPAATGRVEKIGRPTIYTYAYKFISLSCAQYKKHTFQLSKNGIAAYILYICVY